jgi:ribosomal-protein-alanine N-acetyltransferase
VSDRCLLGKRHVLAAIILCMPNLVEPHMAPGRLSHGPQPVLPAGGTLILRPWLAEDAAVLMEAFRDPCLRRWNLRRADSEQEALEWIEQWGQGWKEERAAHWAVASRENDAVLGRVSLQRLNLMTGQADISYWVSPSARGAGVCSKAVDAATRWALGDGGFHRIELGHAVLNQASCRVAEKAGFALEGVRRKALKHTDGWHDMHLHARLWSEGTSSA